MLVSLQALIKPVAIRALLTKEWLQSRVTYNPLSEGVCFNPYPTYAELRSKDPVHWSVLMKCWVCSRYEDVDAILRDHKRFSSDPRSHIPPLPQNIGFSLFNTPSMLFLDPPDHTRLRSLVSKVFTPRAIEALKPHIREIVGELLDQIEDPALFDVIEALAYPLPVIVIAEMLGVPPEDRVRFKGWSHQLARTIEPDPMLTEQERQDAVSAAKELDNYFLDIINQRRLEPREDLISALVAVEEEGNKLNQDELLVMLRLLLVAGNETTTNLIGNGLLALLHQPDQLQVLRENSEVKESAVEELLRYDSPVQIDGRTALEDMEIGGRHIKKGQDTLVLLGSANHDPEMFNNPERLDVTREEASNISFGRGIHYCLGAPLARVEGRIAFEVMLERFSQIRLATDRPQFKNSVVLRGLKSLPISAQAA